MENSPAVRSALIPEAVWSCVHTCAAAAAFLTSSANCISRSTDCMIFMPPYVMLINWSMKSVRSHGEDRQAVKVETSEAVLWKVDSAGIHNRYAGSKRCIQ